LTLADALRVLGLEPGADPETVRRAYLKLIKQHKPEQDPAGFQRLRDAYEIARAGGIFETMVIARTRRDPAPPSHSPPSPLIAWVPPPSTEPATAAAGAEAGDPFERFAVAWSRLAASAAPSERVKVAREAITALPDDPRAHWLLASALSRSDSEEALADALRAAWQKGWPEFLEALLIRVPDRTKRDEVEAAFASERATLRLAAAGVAARWASRRAAAVVVDLCRAATDGPLDAKGDRVRALPIAGMLDVILALHAAGAVDPAADAQTAVRTCLRDSGLELALLDMPSRRAWTLAEEINSLPRDFPRLLREAFARGTRSGDPSYAFWETRAEAARNPMVLRWVDELAESAVNLTGTMRAALQYVPPPVAPPSFGMRVRSFVYCTVLPISLLLAIGFALALLLPKDPPRP
jgi:hypothetical protein